MHTKFIRLFFLLFITLNFAQQADIVDFKKASVQMKFHPEVPSVVIGTTYDFKVLQDTDSIYLNAQNISHYEVTNKTFRGSVNYNGNSVVMKSDFKKGEQHSMSLFTVTTPTKAMYFIDWNIPDGNQQIWTQGQGKYTSNWLASIDDVNDKMEYDFQIDFDSDYEVIANGKLLKKEKLNDSVTRWRYDMKQPMSSYLAALAIGKYRKKTIQSESGIPIELYYYPEDEAKFEPTYRYTKRIFDFLEEEIGVDYPWQNYKQIPVKDFLYAGMENTGTTIFSDDFVVDSIAFADKNYVNVNAHELAHQWFGNLVTAKNSTHHWLQEGFATYYALLSEKEIFGEDYFYWKLYETAMQLKAYNEGKGESVLNPNASSLTFYQKGAWVLHALRTKIGEKAFKKAVKTYLKKYKFGSVETDDFLEIASAESDMDLTQFKKTWLENPQLPETFFSDLQTLDTKYIKNNHLYSYLKPIQETLLRIDYSNKVSDQENHLDFFIDMPKDPSIIVELSESDEKFIIKSVVEKLTEKEYPNSSEVLKKLLKINSPEIRKAVAQNITQIPIEAKSAYETLLSDDSYVTKEAAFYNLWINFPENRKDYLDQIKGVYGFSDRSLRILWLSLALVTPNYSGNDTPIYFKELSGYTLPKYDFQTRMNSFVFLAELQSFTDQNLVDLVNGTQHHNWRFSKFCKDLLKSLSKNADYVANLKRIQPQLNQKEKKYLETVLEN